MDGKATSPLPLPANGEGNIAERVRRSACGTGDRMATVNLQEELHLLPVANSTAHELSEACWCEPEPCTYTPRAPRPGEHYHGWYHHEAN